MMWNINNCISLLLLVTLISFTRVDGSRKSSRVKQHGESIVWDADSGKVKFPEVLDLEIYIEEEEEEEIFLSKAERLVTINKQRSPTGRERTRRGLQGYQETAFYIDENSSLEVRAVYNDDSSTISTSVRGIVHPKPNRKCWISDDVTHCWDFKKEGTFGELRFNDQLEDRESVKRMLEKVTSRERQVGRTTEPTGPTYQDFYPNKVVEILYILDKAFVDKFIGMYDDQSIAIEDMKLYITLVNNEVTYVYRSLKVYEPLFDMKYLDIQMSVVDIVYPPIGTEWSWLAPHRVGTLLEVGVNYEIWNESYSSWVEAGNLDNYTFDSVALVTGADISYDGNPNAALGYAYNNNICNLESPDFTRLLMTEDGDFDMRVVLAHELGHSLGAKHDGTYGLCPACGHVMCSSIVRPDNETRYTQSTFSLCSAAQIVKHLSIMPDCLSDYNSTQYLDDLCEGVRGEYFDVDFICEKELRINGSRYCGPGTYPDRKLVPADACWDIGVVYCTDDDGNCNLTLKSVFQGVPCEGEDNQTKHVCYKQDCVKAYDLCPCSCTGLPNKLKRKCCALNKTIDGSCCTGCTYSEKKKKCLRDNHHSLRF